LHGGRGSGEKHRRKDPHEKEKFDEGGLSKIAQIRQKKLTVGKDGSCPRADQGATKVKEEETEMRKKGAKSQD